MASLGDDENLPELVSGEGCSDIVNMLNVTELFILQQLPRDILSYGHFTKLKNNNENIWWEQKKHKANLKWNQSQSSAKFYHTQRNILTDLQWAVPKVATAEWAVPQEADRTGGELLRRTEGKW